MNRPPHSDPEEVEGALWKDFKGELAFDIGGHVGESLWHLTENFTRIVSVEPAHESFYQLQKEWGGKPGITLLKIAIADHDGDLTTSMREYQMSGGQLVRAGMPWKKYMYGVTSPQESLPWGREVGTRTVPCQTLDWLASEYGMPDFVKIDTEGHEADILRGASALLSEAKTDWLVEFHLERWLAECMIMLRENGYEPEVVRHPHYQPGSETWKSHGWIRAVAVK